MNDSNAPAPAGFLTVLARRRRLFLPLALIAVGVSIFVLRRSHGASSTDILLPPTPTSGSSAQATGSWPSASNTGVPTGTTLTPSGSLTVTTPGAVVSNLLINGEISVLANNVTISNVKVAPTSSQIWGVKLAAGYSGLKIQDSEIVGDGTHQVQYGILDQGSGMTVLRTNIHVISDGIQSNNGFLVQDSYIHDLKYYSGDHNDSFIMTGGSGGKLEHNTLENPLSEVAAIGLFGDTSPGAQNVTIDNNLLIGGGWTVYGGSSSQYGSLANHIVVTNNHFSRADWPNGGQWGPVAYFSCTAVGNLWSGNVWDDTGQVVAPC